MELMQEKRSEAESIELTLARLLRVGSVIAAALMGAGLLLIFLVGAPALGPKLVTSGLIVLISTPVLRVLVAGLVFVRERDWLFALFCLVVMLALGAGVLLGGVE